MGEGSITGTPYRRGGSWLCPQLKPDGAAIASARPAWLLSRRHPQVSEAKRRSVFAQVYPRGKGKRDYDKVGRITLQM